VYKLARLTLRDVLMQSAADYAERPALGTVDGSTVLVYRDLANLSATFATRLADAGLKQGDRVVVLSENRPEWGIAYLGATAAGFVIVPILTDFIPEQVANIIAHSEAKAVVVSVKLMPKIGSYKGLVIPVESLASPETSKAAGGVSLETTFPAVEEDSLAAILYTSGTTGNSKGVMLSHKNLVSNVIASRSIIRMHRTDRFLSILPLAHTYECTLGFINAVAQGSSVWYLDKPPVASVLLPALLKVKPTIMLSVPLIIEKVYRASVLPALQKMGAYKNEKLRPLLHRLAGIKLKKTFGGHLRFFGIGGSAVAPDVEAFLLDAKFPYAIGYGLTETAPLLAGCGPFKTFYRSTGPALKGVEIRIADPKPDTGEGEIQARGPNVMQGYYKDPPKTKEVFTEDGWFRTGDLGIFDAKGRLFIRGRLKTMILGASGENIYPEEIEALINKSAFVAESLVLSEGNGITALVQLKQEVIDDMKARAKDSIEDLERSYEEMLERVRKEVNSGLAAFSKVTKVVIHHEPFEKTPTQKIKRFLYTLTGRKPEGADPK
jgi:long-chain acyl-CoA synthetase